MNRGEKKKSVNFLENISCSSLQLCVFPLEYCRKGCSWRNLTNKDLSLSLCLSLFQKDKKCKNKQGIMYKYITIDNRSEKKSPFAFI